MSARISSQLLPSTALETACATIAAPEIATSVAWVTRETRATVSASVSWSSEATRQPTGAILIAAPFVSDWRVKGSASSPLLWARSEALDEGPRRLISNPFIDLTHSIRSSAKTRTGGTVPAFNKASSTTKACAESSV